MLARLERELPRGEVLYEPKWDGFRCLACHDGNDVALQSRHGRPFARYFPEVVDALRELPRAPFLLDGELVVRRSDGVHDFEALLARIHPAASRVARLRAETPATLVAFDLLASDGIDRRELPFVERRALLEALLADPPTAVRLTPITRERDDAEVWLDLPPDCGIDGVVAKAQALRYKPGARAMVKVKRERTADCVVAGFRWLVDRPLPSSLLLGLYDDGELRHVGVVGSLTEPARERALEHLRSHIVSLVGHPWEHGFLLGGNPGGRLRGSAGSWTPEMTQDWTPVAPELVCEVRFDQVDRGRFRHPARFVRWRPDRDPRSCTFGQLDASRAQR